MRALFGIVFVVIGVLAIVAGVLYVTQPAHALPTFLPGYLARSAGKHTARGIAALAVGAVVLVIGAAVVMTGGRRRSRW
jgi:hypothetical protein